MHPKLQAFVHETIDELLKSLPTAERLKGLSTAERLKGLSTAERLKCLPAEELAKALAAVDELDKMLSPETKEALARKLKVSDAAKS